jgi:hypothetical protein
MGAWLRDDAAHHGTRLWFAPIPTFPRRPGKESRRSVTPTGEGIKLLRRC